MRELRLGTQVVNDQSDCYVIAEIGHNHQGDLDKCLEMFKVAKESGASAVKLQKRDNKTLFTDEAYNKAYENRNSYGATYGEHREFLEFGRAEYRVLKEYAEELGIDFFSTAFDIPSADFLEELDIPMYKIASGDIKTTPLLKHVARFGKPVILSTGGAMFEDVCRARDVMMPINEQLVILQCTAGYPPEWDELNLRVIETYRREFPQNVIGFSGHDSGIAMAVAAYVLGARVVEKHFTLNRASRGTDHAFSLEPVGLRKMVRDLRRVRLALGDGVKAMYPSEEQPVRKMGKSLVASRFLEAGHVLTSGDIAMKSPGGAIPPFELDNLIGRKLNRAVEKDVAFHLDYLS